MQAFSPRETVSELDRFIIGQDDAKKAVAIALRNRWRRQQLEGEIKEEILPKNILMVGPTGVGKTEISRRLSKLAQAPFIKVEATKFTEVGYVGRDVEQIIRDLIEIAITMVKQSKRKEVKAKAQLAAEERVLDCLVGPGAGSATRESFRKKLRNQEIDDKEIEIEIQDTGSGTIDLQGSGGAGIGMININDMLGKAMGGKTKKKKVKVGDSYEILVNEESDKLIDHDQIVSEAKQAVEDNGIVFIDEIDKVCARSERLGGDVSREGVQRDLLPLIEGTVVTTKHGTIKTDHILFIASGAFQLAKPSDLLPELQGRLPIRVALNALSQDDFKRILKEPKFSLIKQYEALMQTEEVKITFTEDGINALATLAVNINTSIENIGARRLHTILERVLEDISFSASDRKGQTVVVDAKYVSSNATELSKDTDLSKFILLSYMSLRNKKNFSYSFRIRYSEVDAQKIVYNSHYLTFLDVAIFEFFDAIGFDQEKYIKETNNEFHTVKATVEYKSPATLGDRIEVLTRIKNIGNSSMTFEQEIYLLDTDNLVATGEIIWVNTNQNEMKPVSVPENLRELLEDYQD